jgi:hypothetical protein
VINLIEHLERQLQSSRRMLGIVLAQGEAIRRQDVEGVLARLGDVQAEMVKRAQIERERDLIVRHAAARLGCAPDAVTLDMLLDGVPAEQAQAARDMSAELRGLLAEIATVHGQNRVLIRQELSFLDHLMRVLSGAPQGGYTPVGYTPAPKAASVLDARV